MRNCDTEANSPIFWEKEQNRAKDLGSVIETRSYLGHVFSAINGLRMFLIGSFFK